MCIENGQKDKKDIQILPLDLNKLIHHKWHWWEYPDIWCRRSWAFLEDIPRMIRWFWQRGRRGYSDRDVWEFHYHISDVVYHGLLQLKKYKHGYPATPEPDTDKWDYNEKRWDDILDKMVAGWELAFKVSNGEIEYASAMSELDKAHMEEAMQKDYPEWRFLTYEEEITMKEGFYLFSKYFFNLWD
jgi:hypothetical protein